MQFFDTAITIAIDLNIILTWNWNCSCQSDAEMKENILTKIHVSHFNKLDLCLVGISLVNQSSFLLETFKLQTHRASTSAAIAGQWWCLNIDPPHSQASP